MSECFVSDKDFRKFWLNEDEPDELRPEYDFSTMKPLYIGPSRRSGQDRRAAGHERRWEACRGRRWKARRR